MGTIEIIDTIECRTEPAFASIIRPCLSYTAVFYQNGLYRKVRKEYQKSTMSKGTNCYYFYTGLLPRVLKYCEEKNVPVKIKGKQERLDHFEPKLDSSIFTDEERKNLQLRQIEKAIKDHRGVIVAPTGLGKTLTGLAIISAFIIHKYIKVLWLCHTKDLMYQSGEEAKNKFGLEVGYIGDGHFDFSKQLTVATRQSFVKCVLEIGSEFDVVLVDEVHHLTSFEGEYTDILKYVFAPVRLGLTATPPKKEEARLAMEAFIGPVIDQITTSEGQRKGLIANMKLRFLRIPTDHKIRDLRRYADVYDAAVTNRNAQHSIIVSKTKEHIDRGDSVLIIVHRINHGQNILHECKKQGVNVFFAQGLTEGSVRQKVKEALNEKKVPCVIATTIWKEGVNIPELNVIINAAGGKSEIATLQTLGRGLRVTERKKELILYDTFDNSHPYLVSHLGERLCVYSDEGWL